MCPKIWFEQRRVQVPMKLETERLILRPWREEDAA